MVEFFTRLTAFIRAHLFQGCYRRRLAVDALRIHAESESSSMTTTSTVAVSQTTTTTPSTNPTIPLPQLSLLPSLANILTGLLNVTGLQSVITLVEQTRTLAQTGNYTPETIDNLLVGVKTLLDAVGTYVPGGAFAQLEAEVNKYEALAAAIEAGQTAQIANVVYVSKVGQKFNCTLSLAIEAQANST